MSVALTIVEILAVWLTASILGGLAVGKLLKTRSHR